MLNEPDPESGGQFPLELAFALGEMGMARSLVEHGANVNQVGVDGSTFLWKAIQNGTSFYKLFYFDIFSFNIYLTILKIFIYHILYFKFFICFYFK
jgi:hypothetical protein